MCIIVVDTSAASIVKLIVFAPFLEVIANYQEKGPQNVNKS
jgi:hypothetical protein